MSKKTTPIHQIVGADGDVLVLRLSDRNGRSYGGFQHPLTVGETVTAPDWNSHPDCGGGIHGWPWGVGIGDGKDPDWMALWQVYAVNPTDLVAIGGKVKFRHGRLVYSGDACGALVMVHSGLAATGDFAASSSTGYRAASSSTGNCAVAVATGFRARARAGEGGCIALAWNSVNGPEMRCAMTGKGKGRLKPHVWYELNARGQFREVKP